VDGADLGARDPFRLLAGGDPAAAADMGAETLVVLPTGDGDRRPGFILLSDHANLLKLDRASGEDLLDHTCAVLGPAVAPR
jgi:CDP-diacylglycerol pyrophosphatase